MTPNEFITKWQASSELKERSASQEHFIDLCRLLGEPTPADADPTGETYCFERGARRDTGGDGWADVWKRYHFAWEYKGRRANLDAAFNQLRQVRAGAGEPAAADRVRHGAVPDPHQLDEQRQPDARVRARRSGRCGDTRQAEVGVLRPRTSAARRDPAVAHRARGGVVRVRRPGAARARSRSAGGRALRQPARLLHVRRRCGPAAPPHVRADAGASATHPEKLHRPYHHALPGNGQRRFGWHRTCRLVQRRAVRRRRNSAAGAVRHRYRTLGVETRLVGNRPIDSRHAIRAGPRSRQARPARGALHRSGQDHAARRASGDQAAARRLERGEDRDRRRAGTCRNRQVALRSRETC